jgi:putative cardiolipin synthase
MLRLPQKEEEKIMRPTIFRLSMTVVLALATAGCATLDLSRQDLPVSFALPAQSAEIPRRFTDESKKHGDASGFRIIEAGVDGLAVRVQMVRNAQQTLDLQYFIFRGDESGSLLTQELKNAADRGVRVRVLVDDGDTVKGDERILALDGYRNVQVRVFNPFDYRKHNVLLRNFDFLVHKSRLDYRMHNKLMVADNATALIGGRNIGNQYFQLDPSSQFADDDVFCAGPVINELSRAFDEFWNSDRVAAASALAKPKLDASPPIKFPSGADYQARIASGQPWQDLIDNPSKLTWASVRVVYDTPDKAQVVHHETQGRLISHAVEQEIEGTHSELVMITPYFVPSKGELSSLLELRRRGAEVRVLSNSLESAPDVAAHSGYVKVREALLSEGVHLHEVRSRLDSVKGSGQTREISRYGNYSLHAKLYVFDRHRLFVGSWNYDQRSLWINTEIGLLIDSPELAQQVVKRFEAMTAPTEAYQLILAKGALAGHRVLWETEINHENVQLHQEPSRGWWQRQKVKVLSWLPLSREL